MVDSGDSQAEEVQLRGYRRDDLRAIFALDVVCFELPFRFTLGAMRRFAEAREALTVVAESAAAIVGFCIVHMERGGGGCVGYVVTLDVVPEWRRHGLARRMMLNVEEQAREAGCGAMALHVSVENAEATRFYERMGYARLQVVRDFYGAGLEAWVYRKALG